MSCRRIEALLPGYVERSLTPRETARCEAHLAACARCQALVEDLRRLPAALSAWSAPEPQLPDGHQAVAWIVERAAGGARRAGPAHPAGRRTALAWSAALLLLLALGAGLRWWRPSARREAPTRPLMAQQRPSSPTGPGLRRPAPPPLVRKAPPQGGSLLRERAVAIARLARRSTARRTAPVRIRAPRGGPGTPLLPRRQRRPMPPAALPREQGKVLVQATPAPEAGVRETRLFPDRQPTTVVLISDDFERGRQVAIGPASSMLQMEEHSAFPEAAE